MPPQDLLLSNPPSLTEQLRLRTDELRLRIVRANYNTQFTQTSPELAEFRLATAGLIDGMHVDNLSELFQKTVHLTTYDSYAPFLARFFEKPCKKNAVIDLLAPGLPDFLVLSSATSGGFPKSFPRYNLLSNTVLGTISDPLRRRTNGYVWYFWVDDVVVEDEDNCHVKTVHRTCGTVASRREDLNLDPERDSEKMATFILDHTAPYAAGFIRKWRSFIVIHVLFAAISRSIEKMSMTFLNTFVDMMRHLDTEFDMIVDCIENGTIPDLDGIEDVRHYLETNISPDPERAAELRRLGRPSSREGWCSYAWPNLRSVTTIASGSFASSIPLARWFLGPNADIHARGYGCTEAWIGSPYDPLELNQFKPNNKILVEFLDTDKSDPTNTLTQLWEVELGKQYELVVTTPDGLWRYRLGDVIEVSGFDPTDGVPIIQFVERHNVTIRFPDIMVTEKDLRMVMSAIAQNVPVNVVDWTATVDDRSLPTTIGFFVEVANDQVPGLALATEYMLDALTGPNGNIKWAIAHEEFRPPTIRLVQPGTFSDFRQLKLDEDSVSLGQIKVPVVMTKSVDVTWLANRVMKEL